MILTFCVAAFTLGSESNLPMGKFILVEGPSLKRKVRVRVNQATVKDGKVTVKPEMRQFVFSKKLVIDDRGGFSEQLVALNAEVLTPTKKWQYTTSGTTTLLLTAPDGEKRALSYAFDGKRLTLRSGPNQVEVFERK